MASRLNCSEKMEHRDWGVGASPAVGRTPFRAHELVTIGQCHQLLPAVLSLPVLEPDAAAQLEDELRSSSVAASQGRMVLTQGHGADFPLTTALAGVQRLLGTGGSDQGDARRRTVPEAARRRGCRSGFAADLAPL